MTSIPLVQSIRTSDATGQGPSARDDENVTV